MVRSFVRAAAVERLVAMTQGAASALLRIIVPAKNEGGRIAGTIAAICTHFGDRATVLVVANGCSDDTADVVRALSREYRNLQLLDIPTAVGKGGAVRAGLTIGDEPYIGFVDADGSTRPDQLDTLLERCISNDLHGAIGSRWLPGSTIAKRQPFDRRVASRAFNLLVRGMFGLPYTDTQCGAKIFRRAAVDKVFRQLEVANFAFDVDLLVAFKRLGCRVREFPIAWSDVPNFSKVVLLRAGSSMFVTLLRLWVRDSIFRNLPWADLLGRSSVIPVKRGLSVLVLTHEPVAVGSRLAALLAEFVTQGHDTDVRVLRTALDTARFVVGYVRSGHRTYDVIVDFIGNDGSSYSGFSTKPKIYPTSVAALAVADLPILVERIAKRCGYTGFLWRVEESWTLSHARVETVLQEMR